MKLSRLFTIIFFVIVIGSISIGVNYLYNFDLNSFREEIETLASERISRPITLGKAHLSFKHGPAFVFDTVRIGTAEDALYLDVEKVFFRLQTLPLLSGEIQFSEILLENPDFSVQLQQSESETPPFQIIPDQRLMTGELIKSLRVINGTIRITDSRGDNKPETLIIEKLRFNIDDFSFLSAGKIRTKATLLYRGVRSPFALEGEYYPDSETTNWANTFYRFNLNINSLDANSLQPLMGENQTGVSFQGHTDLTLQFEGKPQTGLIISAKLNGKNFEIISPGDDVAPVSISEANLDGRIQYTDNVIGIDDLKLTLETNRGQFETENRAQLTLVDNRLASFSASGQLSAELAFDRNPSDHPIFARNLTVKYQADLTRTGSGWKLSNGHFSKPGFEILFRGQLQNQGERNFTLNLEVPEASITSISTLMPGLNTLDLKGTLNAHVSLYGSATTPLQTTGTLNVSDLHLAIPGPLADLNRLNGSILINKNAISAKGLKADLGNSPIIVDLNIPDLSSPEINLHVMSESIRADELIFTSEEQYLKQIDGMVRITDNTVILGPIHVKMDGGTDATVNGTVRNFSKADVALNIQGRHGNIDEIIALWKGDQPHHTNKQPDPHGTLFIDISTDSGQISGMHFAQATSQIVRRNNTLIIGPIHFRSGPGEGLGQVLLTPLNDGSSRLKISGNLKKFDALTVYQQILKRQGLVSGQLNADFYLEGIVGEHFLPTSLGGFSVEIKDGRLHKLTGLAKILHILNLYPILTENVQGKGLPYDKISFNAILDKGNLTTEDYLMEGSIMNMSLAGGYNLIDNTVNFELGAMPLRTVDSILAHIPIAGWLLTGSQKTLVVAHFKMTGKADDPDVTSVPFESLTAPVLGILKRVFTFPVEIISDPEKVLINK